MRAIQFTKEDILLASFLRKGVTIHGLSTLLDGGGLVGGDSGQTYKGIAGSYTATGSSVTFYNDGTGDNEINILPYLAGGISYTYMQGRETVSGEFTGCTMAIYNEDGATRVCHVDTAKPSSGDAPSKARWAEIKGRKGFEMADELSTMGMLGKFLDNNAMDPSYATLSILAIASPVLGITSYYVTKSKGVYTVVGVG
jgi:hypothetical protein